MAEHPASWKDLCVDAVDPALLGEFWAATLGLELRRREDGLTLLVGPTPRHTVWINQVPEAVTVKQRVHLDVRASDVREVLDRGASPVDLDSFAWKVVRDPEGGELCVFERDPGPGRLYEIVVDAADPDAQASWWAEVLGGRLDPEEGRPWASVGEIPGAPFECLVFVAVPEPKVVKNRVHWDVDLGARGLDPLLDRGARVVRPRDAEIGWTVFSDPEGNEFCGFLA